MTIVWLITFLAIVLLLSFQATILFDAYKSKKADIEVNINLLMRESIEKEVKKRREKSEMEEGTLFVDNQTYQENKTYFHEFETYELNEQETFEAGFYQQVLHYTGYPFEFLTLDSIFNSDLQKENLPAHYTLYYRDSTGLIIEQTKDLPPRQLKNAFQTNSLLIINGQRVQAFVVISPPAVYQQMAGLIIASGIVVFFLFFCIFYQTKTILTQTKLNELKNDFINAFVHNIKSPLGTFKNILAQFISREIDNHPEMKEKFGKIGMAQVDNLLLQTEQILTVSKFEGGQSILNRSQTDMNELIKELKEKFSVSQDKQIAIQTSFTNENDEIIHIDRTLIKEAVSNLIDNSIKYSGDSVEIKIDCSVVESTLQIRVIDNGYGISDKDQITIFEKFSRGAAVKRKEAKGFGLGLNYVRQIAEAHGGIVTLFSDVGKGSEFTILLPIQNQ